MAAGLWFLWPFRYGYVSYCTHCAMLRHTSGREMPIVFDGPISSNHHEEETPLSRVLLGRYANPNRPHEWLFAVGGSRWFSWRASCALGRGSGTWNIVKSDRVAEFAAALLDYASHEVQQRWIGRILDYRTAKYVMSDVTANCPAEGFRDRTVFKAWFDSWSRNVDEGWYRFVQEGS